MYLKNESTPGRECNPRAQQRRSRDRGRIRGGTYVVYGEGGDEACCVPDSVIRGNLQVVWSVRIFSRIPSERIRTAGRAREEDAIYVRKRGRDPLGIRVFNGGLNASTERADFGDVTDTIQTIDVSVSR